MKTVIQENLIIRIIKIIFSVIFLSFLFIGTKSDESKDFLIVFFFVCITASLLCFISAFYKIIITNDKIIKSLIVPIKQIDRHSVINMELRKKKNDIYEILFSMKDEKTTILRIGAFFPINDVIESLNNNYPTEASEKAIKKLEKAKTGFYTKIVICFIISLIIAFISIFIINHLLHLENIFFQTTILIIFFGVIFLGFFYLLLKVSL